MWRQMVSEWIFNIIMTSHDEAFENRIVTVGMNEFV